MDEALRRLRSYARERSAKLTDIAAAVVSRDLPASEVEILLGLGDHSGADSAS